MKFKKLSGNCVLVLLYPLLVGMTFLMLDLNILSHNFLPLDIALTCTPKQKTLALLPLLLLFRYLQVLVHVGCDTGILIFFLSDWYSILTGNQDNIADFHLKSCFLNNGTLSSEDAYANLLCDYLLYCWSCSRQSRPEHCAAGRR